MPSERQSWSLSRDPRQVGAVRHEVSAWLNARGIPTTTRTDLLIIVSELVSNAITAARASVGVRLELDQDRASLEVEDDGAGHPDLDQHGHAAPEITSVAGRGLFIVRTLADDVKITSTRTGSLIRATCSLT